MGTQIREEGERLADKTMKLLVTVTEKAGMVGKAIREIEAASSAPSRKKASRCRNSTEDIQGSKVRDLIIFGTIQMAWIDIEIL